MKHRRSIVVPSWIAALAVVGSAHGQGRVVLNNDAWIRIDNGAWLVVEEPTNVGVQTLGTGGNIRSEGEFNRIRWQIRNNIGVYTIPFTTANGVKMPLTYQVAAAGSNEATASICFSTYNYGAIAANNWDNNTYRPSDVTHMHNYWIGPPSNNSDNVVDRFWEIDPGVAGFAYGTRPAIRLGFTYDPGAATGDLRTGNAITGADAVGAQRFNTPVMQWGDYWPAGTFAAGVVNTVTNVNVAPADFFRSWTLSNILEPLPVELVRFNADCDNGRVRLTWTTGSEASSSHFIVERSGDGQSFDAIGEVMAAGSSFASIDYVFVDERPIGMAYYRLVMIDLDGTREFGPLQAITCNNMGHTAIVNAWDGGTELSILILSATDQVMDLKLHDAAGRLVAEARALSLNEGLNTYQLPQGALAMGIYTIVLSGEEDPLVRRVPLY